MHKEDHLQAQRLVTQTCIMREVGQCVRKTHDYTVPLWEWCSVTPCCAKTGPSLTLLGTAGVISQYHLQFKHRRQVLLISP